MQHYKLPKTLISAELLYQKYFNDIQSRIFVTCPPKKVAEVTRPIILMKVCNKLLCTYSWPQTFGMHLSVCNSAYDWPHSFLHPRFLLSIKITFS